MRVSGQACGYYEKIDVKRSNTIYTKMDKKEGEANICKQGGKTDSANTYELMGCTEEARHYQQIPLNVRYERPSLADSGYEWPIDVM